MPETSWNFVVIVASPLRANQATNPGVIQYLEIPQMKLLIQIHGIH